MQPSGAVVYDIAAVDASIHAGRAGHAEEALGVRLFGEGSFLAASVQFSLAMQRAGKTWALLSNRSAAAARAGMSGLALLDAQACVALLPFEPKSHFRLGVALEALHRYSEAYRAFAMVHAATPWDKQVFELMTAAKKKCGLDASCASSAVRDRWIAEFGSSGAVAWGEPPVGLERIGVNASIVKTPYVIDVLRGIPVVAAACGSSHIVVVDSRGRVFSWGRNDKGQLGLGVDHPLRGKHLSVPTLVPAFAFASPQITMVACGYAHTVAVAVDCCVFTWGAGNEGQLGHGNLLDQQAPLQVASLWKPASFAKFSQIQRKVKAIKPVLAGVAPSTSAPASGAGQAFDRTAGHRASCSTTAGPAPPDILLSVSCGRAHTVISLCGRAYAFGSNSHGQLGFGAIALSTAPVPVLLEEFVPYIPPTRTDPPELDEEGKVVPKPTLKFATRRVGGGFESVVLPPEQMSATSRRTASHGHVEEPPLELSYELFVPQRATVAQVACGANFSVVLDRDGQLWGWGDNACGQLAVSDHFILEQLRRQHIAKYGTIPRAATLAAMQAGVHPHFKPLRCHFFHAGPGSSPGDGPRAGCSAVRFCEVACGTSFAVAIPVSRTHVWVLGRISTTSTGPASELSGASLSAIGVPIPSDSEFVSPQRVEVVLNDDTEDVREAESCKLVTSVTCGPQQAFLTCTDGTVMTWGSGIVPEFESFFQCLKLESGQLEARLPDGQLLSRGSKGARVLFAATDDAAQQLVPTDPSDLASKVRLRVAAKHNAYMNQLAAEAGVHSDPLSMRVDDPACFAAVEAPVLAIGAAARQRDGWLSLADRDAYRAVVAARQAREDVAKLKWLRLGGTGTSVGAFLEAYQGAGEFDPCFTIFQPMPDRAHPDEPALADVEENAQPTIALHSQAMGHFSATPFVGRVVCGGRFGLVLPAGPVAQCCEVQLVRFGSPVAASKAACGLHTAGDEVTAVASVDHADTGGVTGTFASESGSVVDASAPAFMRIRDPCALVHGEVLSMPAGEDIVITIRAKTKDLLNWPYGNTKFSVLIASHTYNVVPECDVTNSFNGLYTVVASMQARGLHQVSVQLNGEHVCGSPFFINVLADNAIDNTRSEVFPLDGLSRRVDVMLSGGAAVLTHHMGCDVASPALAPSAWARAVLKHPHLLDLPVGRSLAVEYRRRETLRFGVLLRDRFGNELAASCATDNIQASLRQQLSQCFSKEIAVLPFNERHIETSAVAASVRTPSRSMRTASSPIGAGVGPRVSVASVPEPASLWHARTAIGARNPIAVQMQAAAAATSVRLPPNMGITISARAGGAVSSEVEVAVGSLTSRESMCLSEGTETGLGSTIQPEVVGDSLIVEGRLDDAGVYSLIVDLKLRRSEDCIAATIAIAERDQDAATLAAVVEVGAAPSASFITSSAVTVAGVLGRKLTSPPQVAGLPMSSSLKRLGTAVCAGVKPRPAEPAFGQNVGDSWLYPRMVLRAAGRTADPALSSMCSVLPRVLLDMMGVSLLPTACKWLSTTSTGTTVLDPSSQVPSPFDAQTLLARANSLLPKPALPPNTTPLLRTLSKSTSRLTQAETASARPGFGSALHPTSTSSVRSHAASSPRASSVSKFTSASPATPPSSRSTVVVGSSAVERSIPLDLQGSPRSALIRGLKLAGQDSTMRATSTGNGAACSSWKQRKPVRPASSAGVRRPISAVGGGTGIVVASLAAAGTGGLGISTTWAGAIGSPTFRSPERGEDVREVARAQSGWLTQAPGPTAEELAAVVAAERARKQETRRLRLEKERALMAQSVRTQASNWSGPPELVVASTDSLSEGDAWSTEGDDEDILCDEGEHSEWDEVWRETLATEMSTPTAAASATAATSRGVGISSATLASCPFPILTGLVSSSVTHTAAPPLGKVTVAPNPDASVRTGSVCFLFLQIFDREGLPTSHPETSVECNVAGPAPVHVRMFRVPEARLTNPAPTHLVDLIRTNRRMRNRSPAPRPGGHHNHSTTTTSSPKPCAATTSSPLLQPSEGQLWYDPPTDTTLSSVMCLCLTLRAAGAYQLSVCVNGAEVPYSPVHINVRSGESLPVLSRVMDGDDANCCRGNCTASVLPRSVPFSGKGGVLDGDHPQAANTNDKATPQRTCEYVSTGSCMELSLWTQDLWGNGSKTHATCRLQRLTEAWEVGDVESELSRSGVAESQRPVKGERRESVPQRLFCASTGTQGDAAPTDVYDPFQHVGMLAAHPDFDVVYMSAREEEEERREEGMWAAVPSVECRMSVQQGGVRTRVGELARHSPNTHRMTFRVPASGRYRVAILHRNRLVEDTCFHFIAMDVEDASEQVKMRFTDYRWLQRRWAMQASSRANFAAVTAQWRAQEEARREAATHDVLALVCKWDEQRQADDAARRHKLQQREQAVAEYHDRAQATALLSFLRRQEANDDLRSWNTVQPDL